MLPNHEYELLKFRIRLFDSVHAPQWSPTHMSALENEECARARVCVCRLYLIHNLTSYLSSSRTSTSMAAFFFFLEAHRFACGIYLVVSYRRNILHNSYLSACYCQDL